MTPSQAWKKLGIDETTDRREIKRAYAAKLKTIDPDKDPQAFLALREALETALWQAHAAQWEDKDDGDTDFVDETVDGQDTAQLDPLADGHSVNTNADIISDPDNERRSRLSEILWGDDPIGPLEAEAQSLAEQIIVASEQARIDDAGMCEDWLAWLTANTIRRSDCIIPMLVRHYGWKDKIGSVHAGAALDAIVSRYDDLMHIAILRRPDHIDHASYKRLSEPMARNPNFVDRALHGANLRNFVDRMRESHPTVEWDFNPDTVAKWGYTLNPAGKETTQQGGGINLGFVWLVIILLISLGRMCSSVDTPPTTSPVTNLVPDSEGILALYDLWRSEQDPEVQKRMDAHRGELLPLFWDGRTMKMPSCGLLGRIVAFSPAEERKCLEAAELRLENPPPVTAASQTVPREISGSQPQWFYSSPLWRSEQAPRIQRWMDNHPEELNQLLQPHVKKGGLPDCARLASASAMTSAELQQCQTAQARRGIAPPLDRPRALPPPLPGPVPTHHQSAEGLPAPSFEQYKIPRPVEKPTGVIAGDLCNDPEFKDACRVK